RIPKRYLEQVLQHLVRAGILNGKRGPRGGYRLGREQRRITLGEVVRVVRKIEAETEPSDPAIGSPLAHEVVWPMWEKLRDFMMSFQDITTEYAWGYVWTRPGLAKKTRSMLNLAMLAALNRAPELKLHVNGALNNGLTKDEIKEVFLQVAIYCGIPASLDAFKTARDVFKERGL